jgi:hypothetical protein
MCTYHHHVGTTIHLPTLRWEHISCVHQCWGQCFHEPLWYCEMKNEIIQIVTYCDEFYLIFQCCIVGPYLLGWMDWSGKVPYGNIVHWLTLDSMCCYFIKKS